jgi:hypothetical protein
MTVYYEWDCEVVADGDSEAHEDGECIEHHHGRSFADVLAFIKTQPEAGTRHQIVLVRDDDRSRSWAYVTLDKLPTHFTDADGADYARVPQRFHAEIEKSNHP